MMQCTEQHPAPVSLDRRPRHAHPNSPPKIQPPENPVIMSSSIPLQVAETVQTAHINREPSPRHDLNPSTAASKKEPVRLEPLDDGSIDQDVEAEEEEEEGETEDEKVYRRSRITPRPRRHQFPPMPDLRFEQSYLSSIRNADTWWKVGWITARDQLMMPFLQGIVYNLGLCGWQYWNRNARIHGSSVGARLRRWWYGVNNWKIPAKKVW
ncbi:uncharacterized protein B0H64DRAFT_395632 [Chaetomium fimeti]|uniref:DUF1770-domain-containing protein n=1 Tax=Chaetomium fimeti TaxID=1854472 RepID=A0AAE0HFV9_9PEZI|nr:hypothetical protein B0H64DRAFT_395632 [Chaetomium fimeti]